MKKGKIIAAIVALLVVAGVGACVVIQSQAAIPSVTTATVQRGELARTVTVSGRTDMGERADVYPPTAGLLEQVFVEDGDAVRAGDPIAKLQTEPLELQVAGAEAAYLAANAQLDALEAQIPSQSDLDAADAGVAMAYGAYLDASATTDQLRGAVDDLKALGVSDSLDLGSIETTDPAVLAAIELLEALDVQGVAAGVEGATITLLEMQVASLEAGEDQAYAAYLQALGQAGVLEGTDLSTSLASARAACTQAALALDMAETTLSEATMTAPIDGVVVFNTATSPIAGVDIAAAEPGPGFSVSPVSPPFTVVRLGFLEFVGDVDEADVDVVEAGMAANVVLDAFPGEDFPTEVRKVGVVSQLTATGGNAFPVYLDLAETGRDILIGMRGSADIELARIPDAVSVPIEALFDEGGQTFVYELVDGRLSRIDVEVGEYTETDVEITSGLEGGEEIVLTSSDVYEDGMRVRIGDDAEQDGRFGPFGGMS